MKKNSLIIVILLLVNSFVFSQTTAPKYSNEFLNIGVGARSFGMSHSVISDVKDVTS